jgi:hypothetical protein
MLAAFIQPILTAFGWLGATVVPWLATHLVSAMLVRLGMAVITFAVVLVSINTLIGYVNGLIGGLPSDLLGLLRLFGFFEALSIIASAYLTKAGWMSVSSKLVGSQS